MIAGLSTNDLKDLRMLVDLALKEVEGEIGVVHETAALSGTVARQAAKHAAWMETMTKQLADGQISLAQFERAVQKQIEKTFADAYAAGKGVKVSALTAGDLEYLRRATSYEFTFARRFGKDITSGRLLMPRAERAAMYGGAVSGVAWNGNIERQPDNTLIHWVLGAAEHCDDCITLAFSGPYRKWNLPTTPGAGSTRCRGRCQCSLEYETGVMSRREKEQAAKYGAYKDARVWDTLATEPPDGMRAATAAEQGYIDNLRNEINYHRRMIAQGDELSPDDLKYHIARRKELNAELIEFLQQEGIYEVPVYSVDDVITGADIGIRAQSDLMLSGIDGESSRLISDEEIQAMIRRYEEAINDSIATLAKTRKDYGKGPMGR